MDSKDFPEAHFEAIDLNSFIQELDLSRPSNIAIKKKLIKIYMETIHTQISEANNECMDEYRNLLINNEPVQAKLFNFLTSKPPCVINEDLRSQLSTIQEESDSDGINFDDEDRLYNNVLVSLDRLMQVLNKMEKKSDQKKDKQLPGKTPDCRQEPSELLRKAFYNHPLNKWRRENNSNVNTKKLISLNNIPKLRTPPENIKVHSTEWSSCQPHEYDYPSGYYKSSQYRNVGIQCDLLHVPHNYNDSRHIHRTRTYKIIYPNRRQHEPMTSTKQIKRHNYEITYNNHIPQLRTLSQKKLHCAKYPHSSQIDEPSCSSHNTAYPSHNLEYQNEPYYEDIPIYETIPRHVRVHENTPNACTPRRKHKHTEYEPSSHNLYRESIIPANSEDKNQNSKTTLEFVPKCVRRKEKNNTQSRHVTFLEDLFEVHEF